MAANKQTPIRDTPEYQEIQHDERFRGWLRMQEAAMDIEFTNYDVPELNGHLYTREGLVIAEQQILQRYSNLHDMLSEDNLKIGMRFVYFIGETIRRAIEGTWVALPPNPPERPTPRSVIDSPMWTAFHDPQHMISLALNRRSEKEISFIYDRAVNATRNGLTPAAPLEKTERRSISRLPATCRKRLSFRRRINLVTSDFSDRADDPGKVHANMEAMTPEQLRALTDRLVFTGEPVEFELAPDTKADRGPEMRPRPVAMTDELDLRCQLRASDLRLSRSAYIRHLIEQDLRAAFEVDRGKRL